MAKLEMQIKATEIEEIKKLLSVLDDNIHDLPDDVIGVMAEIAELKGGDSKVTK